VDNDLPISFSLPYFPKGRRVTAREAEVLIRSKISEKKREYEDAIWELVKFYSSTGRINEAGELIEELMESFTCQQHRSLRYLAWKSIPHMRGVASPPNH
jgi:hypothetical protein